MQAPLAFVRIVNMLSVAKIHTLFIFPNVKTKLFMIFFDFIVLLLLNT